MYDVIIIGAGPAGISAAIYTRRANLKVMVLYHGRSELEKAEKIVYGDKKNYYYIARAGSISKQTGFNKNEEDYIKHTSEMLNYIESNYPKLTTAVHRFDIYAKFRILRMLMVTKPRNKQMEKEYILGIKKYQKDVLKCQETPKRDKMAIILLNLGLPIFKITWTIYCKFTNRI